MLVKLLYAYKIYQNIQTTSEFVSASKLLATFNLRPSGEAEA